MCICVFLALVALLLIPVWVFLVQIKAGETAAVIARELAEQTKRNLQAGDITYAVKAMVQLVDLLDVQLRNLTPGGKDSAARSLNKVSSRRRGSRCLHGHLVKLACLRRSS